MPKMTAMDAAASVLVDEGVEVIFGIPDAGILPLCQSLIKSRKIKHYAYKECLRLGTVNRYKSA
jgi:glyoxylate carboligase